VGLATLAAYQAACAAWLVHLQWEVEQQDFWHAASGDAFAQIHALKVEQQFVAVLRQAGLSAEIGCPTSPVSGISWFGVPEVTPPTFARPAWCRVNVSRTDFTSVIRRVSSAD
jgi:hypothetical protein